MTDPQPTLQERLDEIDSKLWVLIRYQAKLSQSILEINDIIQALSARRRMELREVLLNDDVP